MNQSHCHEILVDLEQRNWGISVVNGDMLNVDMPVEASEEDEILKRIRNNKHVLMRLLQCTRCGSEEFYDIPIHGGNSIRRDCVDCRCTAGFPIWNPPPV